MADQLDATGAQQTVAHAMTRRKISGSEAIVRDMKALVENDKVHAVLIVDGDVLLAVVERSDLARSTSDEASALGEVCSRIAPGHTAPFIWLIAAQHVYTVARRREAAPTGSATSAHIVGTLPHHETHCNTKR